MADPRFFDRAGPFSVAGLAAAVGADLHDPAGNPERMIADVAALSDAGPDDLSFLDNRRYVDQFRNTAAGAVVVHPDLADQAPAGCVCLVTKTPYRAYALIASRFYPEEISAGSQHASAVIADSAQIADSAVIGAGVVIGDRAVIGERVELAANVVIGDGVEIGEDTRIGANASLGYCVIGRRVLIHPGVRIGQRGFGFAMDPQGHIKVPQLGRVLIEDDVEIGANSTIDRGAGPDTVIGAGTMIDNLVQIGHNVRTGRGCVIVAQAGVAGSTRLGNFVVIAAQGGVSGHLELGDGARVAAQGGVMRNIPPGQTVGGSPAVPQRDWLKQSALLARMTKKKGLPENG